MEESETQTRTRNSFSQTTQSKTATALQIRDGPFAKHVLGDHSTCDHALWLCFLHLAASNKILHCTLYRSSAQLLLTISDDDGLIIAISANLLVVGCKGKRCLPNICCSLHDLDTRMDTLEMFNLLR